MRNIKLTILSTLIILTAGCAYNTGGSTSEYVSYLYFTGDAQGAEVFIDDASGFIITETGSKNQYKVTPGKHLIVIKRGGTTLVQRNVMLADGSAKEFNIPK